MTNFSLISSVLAFALASLASDPAWAACGTVEVSKGDVKIESGSTKKSAPAAVGAKICAGDTIIAGPDSRAKLKMEDGNELNISPDSKIAIETYQFVPAENKKKVLLNVLQGKVRAATKQENMYGDKSKDGADNSFQVKTKSAVAGVRGTDFLTGFDPKTNKSEIVTFKGKVEFGTPGPGGTITNGVQVGAGQKTESLPGQPPAPPRPVPAKELQQMNSSTKADTGGSSSGSTGDKAAGGSEKSGEKNDKGDKNADKGGDKSGDKGSADKGGSEGGDKKGSADKGGEKNTGGDKSADKGGDKPAGDKPAANDKGDKAGGEKNAGGEKGGDKQAKGGSEPKGDKPAAGDKPAGDNKGGDKQAGNSSTASGNNGGTSGNSNSTGGSSAGGPAAGGPTVEPAAPTRQPSSDTSADTKVAAPATTGGTSTGTQPTSGPAPGPTLGPVTGPISSPTFDAPPPPPPPSIPTGVPTFIPPQAVTLPPLPPPPPPAVVNMPTGPTHLTVIIKGP